MKLDRIMLTMAALIFVGGATLGMYMGITHEFQYAPIHAHANLVGWASLALFGVVYRIYPELQSQKLARAQAACALVSAPLFPIALYLALFQNFPVPLMIVPPIFWLSVVLFAAVMVRHLLTGARSGGRMLRERVVAAE